jgi:hypothetical protein
MCSEGKGFGYKVQVTWLNTMNFLLRKSCLIPYLPTGSAMVRVQMAYKCFSCSSINSWSDTSGRCVMVICTGCEDCNKRRTSATLWSLLNRSLRTWCNIFTFHNKPKQKPSLKYHTFPGIMYILVSIQECPTLLSIILKAPFKNVHVYFS